MAPPLEVGQLSRSVVRIPGSGANKEDDPTCLDLSNVSSLAATVGVPRTLPKALYKTKSKESNITGNEPRHKIEVASPLTSEGFSTGKERKRPRSQDEDDQSTINPTKVAKKEELKTQQGSMSQGSLMSPPGINGVVRGYLLPGTGAVALQSLGQQHTTTVLSTLPTQKQIGNLAVPLVLPQPNLLVIQTVVPNNIIMAQNQQQGINLNHIGSVFMQENQKTPITQSSESAKELMQELDKLKKENQDMTNKLLQYQNLFRKKENLQRIARLVLA